MTNYYEQRPSKATTRNYLEERPSQATTRDYDVSYFAVAPFSVFSVEMIPVGLGTSLVFFGR